MTFRLLRRGELIAVPPVERALAFIEEEQRQRPPGLPLATPDAPSDRRLAGYRPRRD